MKRAQIDSVCECQARLGAELDEARCVLSGWAKDRRTGAALPAPAHTIGAGRPQFQVAWSCPFCIRNPLRSFDAEGLTWRAPEETDSEDWLRQIQAEHNQLMSLLSALEVKLGANHRDDAWAAGVASALDSVTGLLEGHFAREEGALPPEQAARVFPKLAGSIARLNAEHPALLEQFRAARTASATTPPNASEIERLSNQAIGAIRAHEQRETALFADVDLNA